jgi:hypothetical protein
VPHSLLNGGAVDFCSSDDEESTTQAEEEQAGLSNEVTDRSLDELGAEECAKSTICGAAQSLPMQLLVLDDAMSVTRKP